MLKNQKLIIGLVVLVLVTLATGISYARIQASRFSVPSPEEILALPIQDDPGELVLEEQIQTVNGIEIEFRDVRVSAESVSGTLCYQLPSDADWLIDAVQLTSGNVIIKDFTSTLIEWEYSDLGLKTHRCDRLSIPIKPLMELSSFTISIGRIATVASEQPDCDEAQKRLDAENSGITIECIHGYLMFDVNITSKPVSMNEYDAHQIVNDAFIESIPGPWVFTIKP